LDESQPPLVQALGFFEVEEDDRSPVGARGVRDPLEDLVPPLALSLPATELVLPPAAARALAINVFPRLRHDLPL
jgi:hypothetical protein